SDRRTMCGWVVATLLGLSGCARADADAQQPQPTAAAASAMPSASASAKPSVKAPSGMVEIPAGIFLMGADANRSNPEEQPAHDAIVAAFYLDKTEVTMSAYGRCVSAGSCKPPKADNPFCNVKLEGRDDHPVNCIDLF